MNNVIARPEEEEPGADIAALHGVVAARLRFDEVITKVVPRTSWWNKDVTYKRYLFLTGSPRAPESEVSPSDQRENPLARAVAAAREFVSHWAKRDDKSRDKRTVDDGTLPALDRFLALVTLIRWAAQEEIPSDLPKGKTEDDVIREHLQKLLDNGKLTQRIAGLLADMRAPTSPNSKEVKKAAATSKTELRVDLVWQVSLNREAMPALVASVPAVKGDAARRLFEVSCKQIGWAVIDSGIQGNHKAFEDVDGEQRVKRSFDFTNIREIVSLDNLKESRMKKRLGDLLDGNRQLKEPPENEDEAVDYLRRLAEDAKEGRPINWEYVLPFVEIKTDARPKMSDHGTHVAGIIGASARKERDERKEAKEDASDLSDGMCPDIRLYDFRVLAADLAQTEFAIIAALQFIRFLNSQTDYMSIHGANLSLSIPHDVRNYACGRTPICLECERLVDSGVVVVAAAGNLGYQSFQTSEGSYDSYAAFSVTDPGNAEGVLTV
ncbi:MAG TPA: S8 family serine peptidase, partial [Candidatus Paceibacterota bacterium]|nr:S8 family serine peptidase [Candidatus Paceibacterota bacterium]